MNTLDKLRLIGEWASRRGLGGNDLLTIISTEQGSMRLPYPELAGLAQFPAPRHAAEADAWRAGAEAMREAAAAYLDRQGIENWTDPGDNVRDLPLPGPP